ncbi:gas vesicle protein GvpJ [Nocardioides sp. HB32]
MPETSGGYLSRPAPSGLADVVDIILDRGIVIDAYARVSVVGIELLTIDARVIVASADTYLRFAEATNRLDLWNKGGATLPDALSEGAERLTRDVAANVVEDKLSGSVGAVGDAIEGAVDTVEDSVEGAAERVVDGVSEVRDRVADVAGRVVDAVTPGDSHDDSDD